MNKYGWNFDNSYESLPSSLYRKINVSPVKSPKLIVFNNDLANMLGLNYSEFKDEESLNYLSGNSMPEGASSIAQAYMGHQFGYQVILGDGRALLIGEQITPKGERYDIQLKGSGRTSFSRGGDGRAAIGPMMREYLISEALNSLGIPTTRSLSVILTGEKVIRNKVEDGAILVRVAKSHLRVGTFELANYMDNINILKSLADYAIDRHYPEIKQDKNVYESFYKEVCKKQAELIAKWMLVGFIHGVMNTDNMTISGEGIDYGPCAFMDEYGLKTVFSSIDTGGRYAYGEQGKIGAWNLNVLGNALEPLFNNEMVVRDVIDKGMEVYFSTFKEVFYTGLANKLGIEKFENNDFSLIGEFLEILENNNLDFTNTFLDLTFNNLGSEIYKSENFINWHKDWKSRILKENKSEDEILEYMKSKNPAIIPRNYWVQKAIDELELGEYDLYFDLLNKLKTPFVHIENKKKYQIAKKLENFKTYCGT